MRQEHDQAGGGNEQSHYGAGHPPSDRTLTILTLVHTVSIFFLSIVAYNHAPCRVRRQGVVAIAKFRSNRREAVAKLKPEEIDYKRIDVLAKFVTPTGKIEAARRTGASRKQQTRVVRAIKRARYLALLPFTIDDSR